jgi:hypothetical protein
MHAGGLQACNHDGHTPSFSEPSEKAQTELIKEGLTRAGIQPHQARHRLLLACCQLVASSAVWGQTTDTLLATPCEFASSCVLLALPLARSLSPSGCNLARCPCWVHRQPRVHLHSSVLHIGCRLCTWRLTPQALAWAIPSSRVPSAKLWER